MSVSDKAREAVKKAAHGLCEFFHETPVEGAVVAHYVHAGMGGKPVDSERNDPSNLLWACPECHDLVDGRLERAPWKIVRFDREAGVLEIVDGEMRKVDHSRIFFHNRERWIEALERYPRAQDALRRRNEAEYDLAKELAFFQPQRGQPELFRVCPNVKQFDPESVTFRTFVSMLGMTWSAANELIPIGKWANEQELDEMARGTDVDALDALRTMPEEEMVDMLGMAQGKPAEFWAEVDKRRKRRKGKRAHYLQLTDEGRLEDIGLHETDPDVEEAFALVKGVVVRPNKMVGTKG